MRSTRCRAWILASVAATAALGPAGCGSSSEPTSLSPAQAQSLERFIDRARDAARSGDRAGAEAALAEFEGRVKTLQRQGELQADLAGFLSRMALQAKGRVNVDVVPAPPPEPAVVTISATDVPKAGSYDPDKHQKKHEKKDEEAQEHDGD